MAQYIDGSAKLWLSVALWTIGMSFFRPVFIKAASAILGNMFSITDSRKKYKAGESTWFTFFYLTSWFLAAYIVLFSEWGLHPALFSPANSTPVSGAALLWMRFALSFYISSFFFLFVETRKRYSDFWMMFCHHVATITLFGIALHFRYYRGAIFSIFLHDCADIFLEGSKTLHYCGVDGVAQYSFAVLVPTWLIPRCIIWPLTALRAFLSALGTLPSEQAATMPCYTLMRVMQGTIYVLDCIWFGIIARMAANALREGGVRRDIRSSDPDD